MQRLDTKFLFLASIMLVAGVAMGLVMAGSQDFAMAPVHAHTNLVGWASMALFGLTYKSYPELQARWPAKLHFAVAAPGALLFPVGLYLAVTRHSEGVIILASFAWAAGVLLFLGQMTVLAFGGGTSRASAAVPAE